MAERFVCVSDSVYETFDDIVSAKEFAKAESEKSGERIIIYLQYGTMCGAVAHFFGGVENA
jgi:hypothetical protein